eukprot:TRINITY_DN9333_c0_g3_i1.p1 TRINITY_DN9333_c0_g3~~TRINITY_DN9333_c0_g3_i1.p1  ORF type:complete len:2819 (+),score=877.20 TRINITY_DN9333_c0_g3_i1:94-8457(+)
MAQGRSSARDAKQYAIDVGLLKFVDDFVDRALRDRPADLFGFMHTLSEEDRKKKGNAPKASNLKGPRGTGEPQTISPAQKTLSFDQPVEDRVKADLGTMYSKMQKKAKEAKQDHVAMFLRTAADLALSVVTPEGPLRNRIRVQFGEILRVDAEQHAAAARSPGKPGEPGDKPTAPAPVGKDRELLEKQLKLAAETAAPSKFDATDQVKGNAKPAVRSGVDEEDIEPAPERIAYYSQSYHPRMDTQQVVEGLQGWHDPKGRLWPVWAIDRLRKNCDMMIAQHSNGEPREVVVPLFTYSTFMFHSSLWAAWIPAHGGGKWWVLPPGVCEETYRRTLPDGSLGLIDPDCDLLNELVSRQQKELQGRDGEDKEDELYDNNIAFPRAPVTMKLVAQDGLSTKLLQGGQPGFWAGLKVYAARNDHITHNLPFRDSIADRDSTGPPELLRSQRHSLYSSVALDRYEKERQDYVYLARYSADQKMLGTAEAPLYDNVGWLPMPWDMFEKPPPEGAQTDDLPVEDGAKRPPSNEGEYTLRRGTSYVQRVQRSRDGKRDADDGDQEDLPKPVNMYCFPPPGVLEYTHSRRSDEELKRTRDAAGGAGEVVFKVRPAKTESDALITRCYNERNQQQYNSSLHQALREKLRSAGQQLGDIQTFLLKAMVLLKTGDDCRPESPAKPTPLSIAHSLDLQELNWQDRQWFVAFSGKPFAVAEAEHGCMPWYRLRRAFDDQPYWHLNASMRNLSFGKDYTALEVNQTKAKAKKGQSKPAYPQGVVGRFVAPVPETMATGVDLLGICATRSNNPQMRRRFDVLSQRAFRVTFRSASGVRVSWVDPAEDEWRRSEEADYAVEVRAPFEHTWRGVEGPKRDAAHWEVTNLPPSLESLTSCSYNAESRMWEGSDASGQPRKRLALSVQVNPDDCWLDLGTWLLGQSRPLLWQIAWALRSLKPVVGKYRCAPTGNMKLYRGLQNVTLDPKVYAYGKVVLWGQYSSTSKDQGVAQSFAGGPKASVFTLEGSTCRLIAPWSRFGREEEWLFPLNTLWQVTALLTEEQQQILGKDDMQLYEMAEVVTDLSMHLLQVRSLLSNASTAAAAGIIFQAENALTSGGGFLNLALKTADEGSTAANWTYQVHVLYDGSRRCPLKTSTQWEDADNQSAELLHRIMVLQETADPAEEAKPAQTGSMRDMLAVRGSAATGADEDVSEGTYGGNGKISRRVLHALGKVLGVAAPDQATIKTQTEGSFTVHATSKIERWEVRVEIREHAGRLGNAIKDEGASLLAQIIRRGVPLTQIDLTNNDIGLQGANSLLRAVRTNKGIEQLKVDNAGSLPKGEHHPAQRLEHVLQTLETDPKVLHQSRTLDEITHAINIRCLQHQGPLSFDRLEAFGSGWPRAAALALHDCEEVNVDFAGLFLFDTENVTALTETFIVCLVHERYRSTQEAMKLHQQRASQAAASGEKYAAKPPQLTFPKLRGALIAAASSAPPRVVELLIDMKMDVGETDEFGETAFLKARRRVDMRALLATLFVSKQCVTLLDPERDTSEELWRLKNLGLLAMRLWDTKTHHGNTVLREMMRNLKFPDACTVDVKLKLLQNIADKKIKEVTMKRSSLGKIPVDRVNVSLLCFVLFTSSGKDLDKLISDTYNNYRREHEKPSDRSGSSAGSPFVEQQYEPGNEDIAESIREATRMLYSPQSWGSEVDRYKMRDRLERWVLTWALLNCILCSCDELDIHSDPEARLHRTIHHMPGGAFSAFLKLKKGGTYAVPDPAAWRKRAIDKAALAGAPAFTAVHFTMAGRTRGEDVSALLPGSQEAFLLPSLMSYLVDNHSFDQTTSSVTIDLISRGTVFDSDAELVAWRKRVLERAEESEIVLKDDDEDVCRTEEQVEQLKAKQKTALEREEAEVRLGIVDSWAHDLDQQRTLLRRKLKPSSDLTVVSGRHAAMLALRMVQRLARDIAKIVSPCNEFSFTAIRRKGEDRVWTSADHGLHPKKGFPYMKRPACTLLHQIGRTENRNSQFSKNLLRHIELKTPLLDRDDRGTEVVVSGQTIDEYYEGRKAAGEVDVGFADHCAAICIDGPDGASATKIFGDQAFRIKLGELQQLLRSTKITVSPHFPQLFFLELVRRFTNNLDHAWLLRAARAVPLKSFCDDAEWAKAASDLKKGYEGALETARGRIENAKSKIKEGREEGEKGNENKIAFWHVPLVNNTFIIESTTDDLEKLNNDDAVQSVRMAMKDMEAEVLGSPSWFGFASRRQVRHCFAKSLVELSTETCISQKGFFITEGVEGNHNQICPKATNPSVFISAPGLDFCFPMPTILEANKYFIRDPEKSNKPHLGWVDFRQNARQAVHHRIRQLYECIFNACRSQGVRNPSMLPLGLGVFLMNLADQPYSAHLAVELQRTYFLVQYELLSREDWGFENYFINAQRFTGMAQDLLQQGLRQGADYNNADDGMFLRCNVVFHNKDAKFLCQELAEKDMAPAFLNPSDSQAVMLGLLGMYWEVGRGANYVGEEDWAATSTGVLGSFAVAHKAIGLDDVVMQLESGMQLRIFKVDGAENKGLLCAQEPQWSSGDDQQEALGPFHNVGYYHKDRELVLWNEEKRDPTGHVEAPRDEVRFKLERAKLACLASCLRRLSTLAQGRDVECDELDLDVVEYEPPPNHLAHRRSDVSQRSMSCPYDHATHCLYIRGTTTPLHKKDDVKNLLTRLEIQSCDFKVHNDSSAAPRRPPDTSGARGKRVSSAAGALVELPLEQRSFIIEFQGKDMLLICLGKLLDDPGVLVEYRTRPGAGTQGGTPATTPRAPPRH